MVAHPPGPPPNAAPPGAAAAAHSPSESPTPPHFPAAAGLAKEQSELKHEHDRLPSQMLMSQPDPTQPQPQPLMFDFGEIQTAVERRLVCMSYDFSKFIDGVDRGRPQAPQTLRAKQAILHNMRGVEETLRGMTRVLAAAHAQPELYEHMPMMHPEEQQQYYAYVAEMRGMLEHYAEVLKHQPQQQTQQAIPSLAQSLYAQPAAAVSVASPAAPAAAAAAAVAVVAAASARSRGASPTPYVDGGPAAAVAMRKARGRSEHVANLSLATPQPLAAAAAAASSSSAESSPADSSPQSFQEHEVRSEAARTCRASMAAAAAAWTGSGAAPSSPSSSPSTTAYSSMAGRPAAAVAASLVASFAPSPTRSPSPLPLPSQSPLLAPSPLAAASASATPGGSPFAHSAPSPPPPFAPPPLVASLSHTRRKVLEDTLRKHRSAAACGVVRSHLTNSSASLRNSHGQLGSPPSQSARSLEACWIGVRRGAQQLWSQCGRVSRNSASHARRRRCSRASSSPLVLFDVCVCLLIRR